MKTALITGITGQDGSYMAELLLSKGYEVHGLVRRSSTSNTSRIDHLDFKNPESHVHLHNGDLSNSEQIANIIQNVNPDEVYNLAAQSQIDISLDMPEYTGDITGLGTTRILEAIRRSGQHIRFYQASTSELFGNETPPQNENTPISPRSPYACAKAYAYWMTRNYRDSFGIYAVNGILNNHESPRRGSLFVTKKITGTLANILAGKERFLYLGNIDTKRDWGFAPEYVEAMRTMMYLDNPGDYVIGTGETHSVREFVTKAFDYAGLYWDNYVKINPEQIRPNDVNYLCADPTRARCTFDWKPRITFEDLVKIMVDSDCRKLGLECPGEGYEILAKKFPGKWWAVD